MISQLDHQHAAEVEDVITDPPSEQKYEKLKTELIKRLSASREKRVKQLLMHEELGDRKPSQFLRHLQTLAGPAVPKDFLRTLWSSRLPHNIQTVIATQTDSSLEAVADLADKVHEIAPSSPQVASTSSNSVIETMAQQIAALTEQVAALTHQVKDHGNFRPRHRSPNYTNRHNRQRSKSKESSRPADICFYHHRFGSKARKCTLPCKHSENFQGGH